jgi:hypothetical protein
MRTISLCVRGGPICTKSSFLECLSSIYSHIMGIRIWGFADILHKKFAYGDPHMRKCLKKHISDRLFLHNEVVRIIWGLTWINTLSLPSLAARRPFQ